jgi:hypothetical protein
MFAQKYMLPAFAVISVAAAATASVCTTSTATINSAADATAFASCTTIKGDVLIGPDAAGVLALDGPEQITGDVVCNNAGGLVSLTSSTIATIGGSFSLFNLTLLSTLQFNDLTKVETIDFNSLPALSTLTFPSFISTASSLTVTNTFLKTLDGINLMTVGLMDINNNLRLANFSTQVANITQSLNIAANGQALDVDFPNLIWANNMTLRNISVLSVPSLATVNGSFILDEGLLTTLSTPNLTTVGSFANKAGSLSLVGNSALSNITFPQLNSVGGGIQIANNTALDTIAFPALTQVGGAVDLAGNFSTPSLPALENVQGAMNIQSTAVITCSDFTKLSGNVVQGADTCKSATDDPTSIGGSSTSSGGSSSTTSKGAAAGSYTLTAPAIGLSVIGGLLGMLV